MLMNWRYYIKRLMTMMLLVILIMITKTLCSSIESTREKLESIPDVDIEKYSKIKVLIIEPGQEPKPEEIINDFVYAPRYC